MQASSLQDSTNKVEFELIIFGSKLEYIQSHICVNIKKNLDYLRLYTLYTWLISICTKVNQYSEHKELLIINQNNDLIKRQLCMMIELYGVKQYKCIFQKMKK